MGARGRPRKLKQVVVVQDDPETQQEVISPADVELADFLDGLGPAGITDVKLSRIERTGKQLFLTSGPPSQFSELYVQVTFGPGDYMVRAYKDGKWQGSKNFSVGPAVGTLSNAAAGASSELDRIKADLEAQRTRIEQQQLKMEADRREQDARMEADRRDREQRNHELQLEMFRSFANRDNNMNIADIISAVKSLKEMGGENGNSTNSVLSSVREGLQIVKDLKAETTSEPNSGADDPPWLAIVKEIVSGVKEVAASPVAPLILSKVMGTANGASAAAASNAIATPSPAAIAPITAAGQAAWVPPAGAGVIVSPVPSATAQPAGMVAGQPAASQPTEAPQATAVPAAGASIPQPAAPPSMSPEDVFHSLKKQLLQDLLQVAMRSGDPTVYAGHAFEWINMGEINALRLVQELMATKNFGVWFVDMQKLEPLILNHRDWFSEFYEDIRERATEWEAARLAEQPAIADKKK